MSFPWSSRISATRIIPGEATPSPRLRRPNDENLRLAIPKLRQGSFFPSLLCPRKRVDKALYAVICSAWIEEVSTRKVDDLVGQRVRYLQIHRLKDLQGHRRGSG